MTLTNAGEIFNIDLDVTTYPASEGLPATWKSTNEKIMTVDAGSWRVVQMDITIDEPGDHTIAIGDAAADISIAE